MCRRNTWGTLLQCIGNIGRVRVPMICLVLAHFLCFVFYISEKYIIVHMRTKYPAINNKGHVLHANVM